MNTHRTLSKPAVPATILVGILALACIMALAACRAQPRSVDQKIEGTLAVAGFTQPMDTWELLAGFIPENAQAVKPKVLTTLDMALESHLDGRPFVRPAQQRACSEMVKREDASRTSAMRYWLDLGKCLEVDFILVPQLIEWREKDISKEQTASVMFELFLLDVREQRLAGRFHFDDTQRSLSENLLDIDKFLKRGGKWISAMELANEGLARGIEELWL